MDLDLDYIKNMLKQNGFNFWDETAGSTQNSATEELEKEKFTEEEFEKACEDLGLEDSGEESDDVYDFFQQLNQV